MRITKNMIETFITEINNAYGVSLSVKYFNGRTHIYISEQPLFSGTKSECYDLLNNFMCGFYLWHSNSNSEVK